MSVVIDYGLSQFIYTCRPIWVCI